MDVFLILFLLYSCLTGFANGNSFSKTIPISNEIRFVHLGSKTNKWHWNPSTFTKSLELKGNTEGSYNIGDEEFEKAVKAISSLEISKSIELVFDPKVQALVPTVDIPKSQIDRNKAHDSAIVLLSPKTFMKLKKVFEYLEREKEKGGNDLKDFKNFQTGRFKSKYFKSAQGIINFMSIVSDEDRKEFRTIILMDEFSPLLLQMTKNGYDWNRYLNDLIIIDCRFYETDLRVCQDCSVDKKSACLNYYKIQRLKKKCSFCVSSCLNSFAEKFTYRSKI